MVPPFGRLFTGAVDCVVPSANMMFAPLAVARVRPKPSNLAFPPVMSLPMTYPELTSIAVMLDEETVS
jgi:hypothetical protein